jgi:hypothetical protein
MLPSPLAEAGDLGVGAAEREVALAGGGAEVRIGIVSS